jgi:predicted TIM-barrel fold metal-dependent hydrolase
MKAANPSPIAREYMAVGRSESCPIIDMHGHLGHYGGSYFPSAPIEKMVASLERCGVRRIVCAPHSALFSDPDAGNASMQATIDLYPERFLGYWSVNPNHPAAASEGLVAYDRARGFVGLKLLPDYHTCALNDHKYADALAFANERRLLVLVHTWGGSAFNSPELLAEVAQRYPEARFLMGHSGYGAWQVSVAVARDLSNVYLELTAVYVAHDYDMQPYGSGTPSALPSCLSVNGVIEYMVQEASSKKVVFGTDMPWYSPYFAAGAVLFARIDDAARHDILHGNAERLLADHL